MTRARMHRCAVLGQPIGHSLSPLLHTCWLRQYCGGGSYEAFNVTPEAFEARVRQLRDAGYRGINVTLPHKAAAFACSDTTDQVARSLKAANTLVFTQEGIQGWNTDVFGFTASLDSRDPHWRDRVREQSVLVWGAGGAARAIIKAVLDAQCRRLYVVNRSPARIRTIQDELGDERIIATPMGDAPRETLAMVVNASSLGMVGFPELAWDAALKLAPQGLVCESVYRPLETRLLREARLRGFTTVDGLGMLIHQARKAFHLWFARWPKADAALRQILERELAAPRSVSDCV